MCFMGLHEWKYAPAEYDSIKDKELGIARKSGIRKCSCCGKVQFEDRHLLGLNPPEYCVTWMNKSGE